MYILRLTMICSFCFVWCMLTDCCLGVCARDRPVLDLRHIHLPRPEFPRNCRKPHSATTSLWVSRVKNFHLNYVQLRAPDMDRRLENIVLCLNALSLKIFWITHSWINLASDILRYCMVNVKSSVCSASTVCFTCNTYGDLNLVIPYWFYCYFAGLSYNFVAYCSFILSILCLSLSVAGSA